MVPACCCATPCCSTYSRMRARRSSRPQVARIRPTASDASASTLASIDAEMAAMCSVAPLNGSRLVCIATKQLTTYMWGAPSGYSTLPMSRPLPSSTAALCSQNCFRGAMASAMAREAKVGPDVSFFSAPRDASWDSRISRSSLSPSMKRTEGDRSEGGMPGDRSSLSPARRSCSPNTRAAISWHPAMVAARVVPPPMMFCTVPW
mmetsp:Transcript_1022/g.2670  ORF Transcript_1022/g.2670 Transcript_1022/m.2670 type:complete len:205 (-) Transcript_1022:205-819(-)